MVQQIIKQQYLKQPPFRTDLGTCSPEPNAAFARLRAGIYGMIPALSSVCNL